MTLRTWMNRLAIAAAVAIPGLIAGQSAQAQAPSTLTIVREVDSDRYDPPRSTARAGSEVLFMLGDNAGVARFRHEDGEARSGRKLDRFVSPDGKTYTPSSCAMMSASAMTARR